MFIEVGVWLNQKERDEGSFLLRSVGLSSSSRDQQTGHAHLTEMQRLRLEAEPYKISYCFISEPNTTVSNALCYWPKQAMWWSTKSDGKEIYSTSFKGRITEAHSKRCGWRKRWRIGAFASIYTIYHTACLIFLRFLKFRVLASHFY